jgi:hypothetical protein
MTSGCFQNEVRLKDMNISGHRRPPQKNVTTELQAIPQQEFQKRFQQWQHRWAKYLTAQG